MIDCNGLCTNHTNIFEFVSANQSIEKIIVDCFPFDCNAIEFNREQILEDINVLPPFNCRRSPRQRSKECKNTAIFSSFPSPFGHPGCVTSTTLPYPWSDKSKKY
ncbi:hypothetical protein FB192DRAFT_1370434 [Mucor lusitanicus]|uniref:Uncharacterized protein n=1 Tax=Mucor circinelloides f. lusitanicus TaxID=29924 RepID=A0A8H4BM74_MUCCL|nr:hypothetical protein FB192DRAFT_1370434 [Mucor lusitanicus]